METLNSRKPKTEQELIHAVEKRMSSFPSDWIKLHYSPEVNSLYVQLSTERVTKSNHDVEKDIIYHFSKQGEMISFEIIGLNEE